jgi:hypothetical protein
MNYRKPLLAILACAVSMAVSAHWQWLDKDGRKVFSDRSPPSDIPEKNILQRPAVTLTPVAPQAAASLARPTPIDKGLQDKRKQLQEVEIGKRKLEEEKATKTRAENCQRAKASKASFDSGRRIAKPNEKGEPEILDAQARAAELTRLEEIIESNCN